MWAKELYGFADHTPETDEYGVTSFVYRARQPFVPEKIMAVLNGEIPGVIRAKGHFWFATRPDWVAEFSRGGRVVVGQAAWYVVGVLSPRIVGQMMNGPRPTWWTNGRNPGAIARQEIVFIGAGIDWPTLTARLDAALLPEDVALRLSDLPDLARSVPSLAANAGFGKRLAFGVLY